MEAFWTFLDVMFAIEWAVSQTDLQGSRRKLASISWMSPEFLPNLFLKSPGHCTSIRTLFHSMFWNHVGFLDVRGIRWWINSRDTWRISLAAEATNFQFSKYVRTLEMNNSYKSLMRALRSENREFGEISVSRWPAEKPERERRNVSRDFLWNFTIVVTLRFLYDWGH